RRQQVEAAGVLSMVASAREASKAALQHLRKEISATRTKLEKLVTEERSFRLDLFGTAAPGRPRVAASTVSLTSTMCLSIAGRFASGRRNPPKNSARPSATPRCRRRKWKGWLTPINK